MSAIETVTTFVTIPLVIYITFSMILFQFEFFRKLF